MAPRSSVRRRASSSPDRGASSAASHRNVRPRASSSPGGASSTPTIRRASSASGDGNRRRRALSSPGGASPTPTARASSSYVLKTMKGPWKLVKAGRQALQKRRNPFAPFPDQLYELFISEKEKKKCSKFHDFFSSEARVTAVDVPGQKSGAQYMKFSDPARISSAALIDWLLLLKDLGYSLAGHFEASDFSLTYLGYLKANRNLLLKVKKFKVRRGDLDMAKAADLIEYDICSGAVAIPAEVKHLLDLLRQFQESRSFIVRHHASLYNEVGKEMLFSSLYARLKKLEKLDKSRYKKIVGKLPYCSGADPWKVRMEKNTYLKSLPTYPSKSKSKVKLAFRVRSRNYKGNGGELLRCRRNGQQHLPDSSTTKKKKKMVELYGPEDQEHMFAVAVPNLLVSFQLAMDDEGQAERLGWYEPSRGRRLLRRKTPIMSL